MQNADHQPIAMSQPTDTPAIDGWLGQSFASVKLEGDNYGKVVVIVAGTDGKPTLVPMTWGLSSPMHPGLHYANAMVENVIGGRREFVGAYERRCLVPASGYYEISRAGVRRPYYIKADTLAQRWQKTPTLFLAGIWNKGIHDGGDNFCLITTPANGDVAFIHPRMLLFLDPADYITWLTKPNLDREELTRLLAPPPTGLLRYDAAEVDDYAPKDGIVGLPLIDDLPRE
jgi:putative SOS response-associated peptidase YedK